MFFCIQVRIPHTRTSVAPPWSKVSYAGQKWKENAGSEKLNSHLNVEMKPTI